MDIVWVDFSLEVTDVLFILVIALFLIFLLSLHNYKNE